MPFSAGVTALQYIDQRIRREALDLELAQRRTCAEPCCRSPSSPPRAVRRAAPRLPALPGRAPVELTREQAAELARTALADPAYHPPDDPILLRLFRWLTERVEELVDRIGSASPGGWLGLLGLAVVVVAVLVVVRGGWGRSVGPARRRGRCSGPGRR